MIKLYPFYWKVPPCLLRHEMFESRFGGLVNIVWRYKGRYHVKAICARYNMYHAVSEEMMSDDVGLLACLFPSAAVMHQPLSVVDTLLIAFGLYALCMLP